MIQAWTVYRGYEIERASETEWHVRRNREQVHVAASLAAAQAWIDNRRERDFSVRVRASARKHK
jgi:hypothetical protein